MGLLEKTKTSQNIRSEFEGSGELKEDRVLLIKKMKAII